jgi:D-hydroxyproline dehydrogenase subunit beta
LTESYEIAIIGGGIVGAACFNELARGGTRVCLLEASHIGGGATAAAMGHIAVMDDSEAQFALTRYSQELWKELASRLGPEAGYFPCGAIWIAAGEPEMAEVQRKFRYYADRDTPVQVLDSQALAAAEPNLRPDFSGGLLVKDDAVVYPAAAARHLVDEAVRFPGAALRKGRAVKLDGDAAQLEDGSIIRAKSFVLATGTAVKALFPDADVRPRKGHLAITDPHPGFVRHQVIELAYLQSAHATETDSVAFNIQPRASGQLLIGSSRQFSTKDPAVEDGVLSSMLARAFEYMPGLRSCNLMRSWTGFRAATSDRLPLIGPSRGAANVYFATGHEGLGITTSLGTAKLVAKQLLGTPCPISVEPYLPNRTDR